MSIKNWKKTTTPYVGSPLESFSFIKEGFSYSSLGTIDVQCNDPNNLQQCVQDIITYQTNPIATGVSDYTGQLNVLNQKMVDLSSNVVYYNQTRQPMLNPYPSNNRYYDYIGNVLRAPPTLQDAVLEDNYTMQLRENTTMMIGSVVVASLLIAGIVISSK